VTLVRNKFGVYEADITDRVHGRLHQSLKTKRKDEGNRRHTALEIFVRQANADLVEDLRKRRINIAAIEACVREQRPFSSLRVDAEWPVLGQAIDEYLAWMDANPKRAKSTHLQSKHYLTRAREFFGDRLDADGDGDGWIYGDQRVDRISGDQIVAYAQHLRAQTSKITKRGFSAWSISLHLQKLGALYTWLNRQEARRAQEGKRVPRELHNPIDRDLITSHAGGRVRFLVKDEAARLIAATPEQLTLAILLGLTCGLRLGEVAHLRPPPHDMDLEGEHPVVSVQPKDGWRVKTGKRREVPIPAELIPIIERHIAKWSSPQWLFPSPWDPEQPLTEHALGASFRRIAADAELSTDRWDAMKVTFHTLRHTFASWLIMGGADLFTVSKLMGHSSIDQVVNTYGHLSPDHKQRAVAQLGTWLGGLHLLEGNAA